MAYNPYNIAGTQQGLLESLLQAKQAQKIGQAAVGEQVGEMGEEFQKEQRAAQKEQERLLKKKRKKGFLEQIAPIATMFIPGMPILTAALSGLSGMYSKKAEQKHMERKIGKAEKAGLDSKWGKTFLGQQARDIGVQQETMLDDLLEQSKVSDLDMLTRGLGDAVSGYALGKTGEGITESVKNVKLQKALEGAEGMDLEDISGSLETLKVSDPATFKTLTSAIEDFGGIEGFTPGSGNFMDIIKNLQSPDTLIPEGTGGEKAIQYLGLLSSLLGGEENK